MHPLDVAEPSVFVQVCALDVLHDRHYCELEWFTLSEVLMKRKQESSNWVLIALAAAFLVILASRAADVQSFVPDRGLLLIETPAAELFLLRDEWLGSAEFILKQPLRDRASLELFNQFAVRPSLDTVPDCLGRKMKDTLDKAFLFAVSAPPPEPLRIEL